MPTIPRHSGVLQIEPTDRCNLACRMCPPHADRWPNVHGIPKGLMSISRFERVIDVIVSDGLQFDHVILQWLGDPSVHPDLERLVGYASENLLGRIGYLRFDTNGILMTPTRWERLLLGLHPQMPLTVVFTLDAARDETYAVVKGREGLGTARRHIRDLLARRARMPNPQQLSVQVQFVVQPQNAAEVAEFAEYWLGVFGCTGADAGFNEILYKPLSVGGGATGQAASDALYRRALSRAGLRAYEGAQLAIRAWEDRPWQSDDAHSTRGPCAGLWYTPVVRHDGHLVMCCADLRSELDLGEVQQSFKALWEGPRARAERAKHRAGRFEGVCAGCGGINWYALGPGAELLG